MEDDDEFGDLYTDVLSSFPSSSSSLPPPAPTPIPTPTPALQPPPPSRPIDLNLESEDADDIPNSNYSHMKQQLDVHDNDNEDSQRVDKSEENTGQEDSNSSAAAAAAADGARVLLTADVNDQQLVDDVEVEDVDAFQNQLDKHHNFGIEDFGCGAGGGDEWDSDSDSEDDLQIVLNDARHAPPAPMIVGSDDEDEDGDPLVILADDDDAAGVVQAVEDQDWGDEAGQSSQGKETSDASKLNANAGLSTAPKVGYSNYGYHPFHSQFKYIRPGAAPLPGGPSIGSGGAPGQVRPPVSVSTMAGRGRGDWRPPGMKGPPVQKGFHTGFWGSNVPGRGLEFTLPSHKTIFDVDIDSFEEKPWKYTGVDVSDFFNFGLNEESWKEYCKQLEQLRLESTMQSKIRVYESGRTEQEYDPDMPPELVAAAGIHDSAENVDTVKVDGGQGDLAKGSARVRPPLPTGRAIQVETGNGERLPSVDTRPPRVRDSDSVIEIVLQDSIEDESAGNDDGENPDSDSAREDDQVVVVDEDGPECGDGYFESYPRGSDDIKEDDSRKKNPIINSHAGIEEVARLSPQRASSDHQPGSRDHASSENIGSPYEERWTKERARERSPHMSSGESALERRSLDYQREDSIESMEGKHSPKSFSATPLEDVREGSSERKAAAVEDNKADVDSGKRKDDSSVISSSNTSKEKQNLSQSKQLKLSSQVEPQENNELDEVGDFKASRSSDNSKATGSSRDHQKWREGVDEEVVQNGRSSYPGDVKRNHGEGGHDSRRKDREGRVEMERNYILAKGREEYYSHREWDPLAVNHFHARSESSDRRKERDLSEAGWQRRDEDPHGRRIRAEDARKQERADEMVSRRRSKAREVDRSDKDEYLHSRKVIDNGIWRGYHDKDVGFRYREKDDVSKSRHEILDDHHIKRRKDDEHARRDHVEKDDHLLSHRDSSSTRRKRERDGILSLRKREDQPRIRDNMDDHHLVRLKDDVWVQKERERAEQQRDRDEWYRAKQSYEETLSRREREDGRAPIRSSRNVEEKIWVGHSRVEEYKGHDKDTGRHGEQLKRRERVEEEPSLQHRGGEDAYARGNQFVSEGKRSRQERSSARNNRAIDSSESLRLHEKKHKENVKRTRESEGHNTSGSSKRYQGEKGLANEMADIKGRSEQSMVEHDTSLHNLTGEVGGDVSSDDELHDSKRGRSKLERWTSHKDRDYDLYSKSSSLKNKEISKNKNTSSGSSFGVHDEIAKKVEACDSIQPLAGGKEVGGSEGKDGDERALDGRHLDTVEKLKRRSERFKLPLTSEKDPLAIKKMESEPLPSPQNDTPANAEVKHERPPRKRRWIGS
ncbi:FIP1[V]-like protein [Chenopodium quinoa]|uniref:FIP1[V]-like protein n=1 Tax=Chenopodium quinoa TaxID=63459 RepID=UPI000B77FC0C|nr:FIP1[V]-like protein [Chenopodium quinoa]